MEAGINADQNFYRRQFPQSSEESSIRQNNFDEPQHRDFESRPPQPPPKVSLITDNLPAPVTNGYGAVAVNTPVADEFYREFRGTSQSGGYNSSNTNGTMTAAQPATATWQSSSSFRSNSNGTTPKHPTVSASRNALKSSYRSASAPIDERMALSTAKSTSALKTPQQTSVKEMLKRFDQNTQQTTSASRKPPIRTPLNENGSAGLGYLRSRSNVENQTSVPASRAGMMTRETAFGRAKSPTATRATQRSKFATEDQHSNNALSSVARTARSRQDISGNAQASQSMTNLAPVPPPKQLSPTIAKRPLFGEVVPEESGPLYPGYGIEGTRLRRTSDGNLSQPSWRQRSQSDAVAPPSPTTAWYRDTSKGFSGEFDAGKTPRQSRQHNRSQSDFMVEKGGSAISHHQDFRDRYRSPPPDMKQLSQSRLPLSSKRLSTPSESASPPSTRSASPSKAKTQATIAKPPKSDTRPWSPAGRSTTPLDRSKTPSGRSITPTNKPIPQRSPGRQIVSPPKISISNSSLKAYISAPPPKLSPPLRSSRPRLPVSSATTASSRAKTAERSESPQVSSKIPRNGGSENKAGARNAARGPVDFAAKREQILRSYSKVIQESEEKELRAARLRRLVEERAVNTGAKEANENATSIVDPPHPPSIPVQIVIDEAQSPKLEIQTSFPNPNEASKTTQGEPNTLNSDSPTLGIPGSFPKADPRWDEEDPKSAISNITEATDFDIEPQTEPASEVQRTSVTGRLERKASTEILSPSSFGSPITPSENILIPIILDTTLISDSEIALTGTNPHEIPNRYADEVINNNYDYHAPVFASTSPMETLEEHSLQSRSEIVGQLQSDRHGSEVNGTPPVAQYLTHAPLPDSDAPKLPSKIPLWESKQRTVASSSSPPMIETSNVIPTFQSELVQTPITEIDSEASDDVEEGSSSCGEPYDGPFNNTPQRKVNQHFGWTENSTDNIEESNWRGNYNHGHPLSLKPDEPPQPPPKEEFSKPEVPPKPINYSPLPSPRSVGATPRIASPGRTFKSEYSSVSQRRPSESNGMIVQDIQAISPVPALPDHSPPPPPQGAFPEITSSDSARRLSSSLYRSNRDPESRRESNDDITSSRPSISTPVSSTRISLVDVTPQSSEDTSKAIVLDGEEKEAAEKLAKRLQHRGRVVKELIDTESVYLKDMNVVEEIYKGTAEACPKLEPSDIKTIFRNTDQIVAFSTMFLDELKAASASVYSPRLQKSRSRNNALSPAEDKLSMTSATSEENDLEKDRKTRIGEYFGRHLKEMQMVYTDFLKSSEQASTRLTVLQSDSAVKVWLNECNHVAKDLTAAWDLDALLIKPVQRITRYQLLLKQLLELTPDDHPDHQALQSTLGDVGGLLKSIDDLKKRLDTVHKIVGRKRKESDVRSGLAKAFGRSREKSLASGSIRFADDEVYVRMHDKFGDDYLRLQVVLRDVEFYTRQANIYVNDFLRLLSAMELVMRVSPSPFPELESKWARFNMSMRDMGTVALEDHIALVRKKVIEPFEKVIKMYGPPDLVMKKRKKRRLDYERSLALKASNKKIDEKLAALVEEYESLNETLKFELPQLSALTERVGNVCLIQFVSIQVDWLSIWQEKVRIVLEATQYPRDIEDIIDKFNRDFKYQQGRVQELSIANGAFLEDSPKGRLSNSTTATRDDDSSTKSRTQPPQPLMDRSRDYSINSDHSPSLPTPDFARRQSGQFSFSPIVSTPNIPTFSTRDFPPADNIARGSPAAPTGTESWTGSKPYSARSNTRRSYESGGPPRTSVESGEAISPSGSAYYSATQVLESFPASSRPFSGLFHSAMPTDDAEGSRRSSRASSRDRERSGGYNVLYWAASLFEFNIGTIKTEAGYPYLTYAAGEIFDVIGEKGELWLAKNQDDPTNLVGWIWSKHFARLAD